MRFISFLPKSQDAHGPALQQLCSKQLLRDPASMSSIHYFKAMFRKELMYIL